jgi:putative chitinase
MQNGIKGTELAQFMAQCAHETANFTTLKEYGGKLDFRKYDIKYNPAKAKALGNVHPGDGFKYFGRGFIQLTGKYNYEKAGEALGLPLAKHPELVERPDVAAKVAVWFWKQRVQPNVDNFNNTQQATKPINPGMHGLKDRHDKFAGIKVAMTNLFKKKKDV